MSRRFPVCWAIFVIAASVHVSGCSVINYGVGSGIDARRNRTGSRDISGLIGLRKGARLVVRKSDGTSVAGIYEGLVPWPDSAYLLRYGAWRDTARVGFQPPALGDLMGIRGKIGVGLSKRRFQGFGPRFLHATGTYASTDGIAFEDVSFVVFDSTTVTGESLLRVSSGLPIRAVARIRQGQAEHPVDLLDPAIVGLEFAGHRSHVRTKGLLIGLLVDVTILAGAAALAPR